MKLLVRLVYIFIPIALGGCKKDNSSFLPCPEYVSPLLFEAYQRDVVGVAIDYLDDVQDPRLHEIEVPEDITTEIWQGLQAIYREDIPVRDSIFSQYCVHHVSVNPTSYSCIVQVSEGSIIAEAWKKGELYTGITALDELIKAYQFSLIQFNGLTAVLHTNLIINMPAFTKTIKEIDHRITNAQPNLLLAGAGRINYSKKGGYRYFEFVFEWFDCYDLCDNYHKWKFRIDPNCHVKYLGVEKGGINGPQPLPEPLNCGL